MSDRVHFDGPCPFLLCLATGPHSHPVCPECGAIRYGNLFCGICRAYRARERRLIIVAGAVQTVEEFRV